MRESLSAVVLLGLGGGVGTNARYWIAYWFRSQGWGQHFPLATFVINVSGSLVLGILAVLFLARTPAGYREWFLLLGTGFCGGYTTFSTFEFETFELLRQGRWALAVLNVMGSVLAGFLAVWLAVWSTETMFPRH